MRKPALLTASMIALAVGAIFLVAAIGTTVSGGAIALVLLTWSLAIISMTGAFAIFMLRQDKQNKRSNSYDLQSRRTQEATQRKVDTIAKSLISQENELFEKVDSRVKALESVVIQSQSKTLDDGIGRPLRPGVHGVPSLEKLTEKFELKSYKLKLDADCTTYYAHPLNEKSIKFSIPVKNSVRARINIQVANTVSRSDQKAAIVSVVAFDDKNKQIDFKLLDSYSGRVGYFKYLATNQDISDNLIEISIPRIASRLEVKLDAWASNPKVFNTVNIEVESISDAWFAERTPKDITVASILDEFSYNSFKYECDLISLTPQTWRRQFEENQPDIFFCESAWSGADSVSRPWMGRVYSSVNFNYENRQALLDILSYCKEHRIPTVFWNKEDPTHYSDKKHNFVDTAIKFDHIFTTATECVQMYKDDYGHKSVDVLPFAAQPRLFNPISSQERSNELIFAGGWYANHESRNQAMRTMFDAALESGNGLKIYDRFFGSSDETKEFPQKYQSYLNPPVPNDQVANVYKESEIGMTINTVTDSKTMFARRIFELMACNTLVVSNYSVGVHEFFGNNVIYLDNNPAALSEISQYEKDRIRQHNLEDVLSYHTYAKRFATILEAAGVTYKNNQGSIDVVVRVASRDEASRAWKILQSQGQWTGRKTILCSSDMDSTEYATILADWGKGGIQVIEENMLLEERIAMHTIMDTESFAYICAISTLENERIDSEILSTMTLHHQYVDCPVVSADTTLSLSNRYKFIYTDFDKSDRGFMVNYSGLPGTLQKLSKDEQILVYVA